MTNPPSGARSNRRSLELGFLFSEASRGEEALQLLHSGQYDVVLLDINMPGIGGMRHCAASAHSLPASRF